jgi:hypothetical protein
MIDLTDAGRDVLHATPDEPPPVDQLVARGQRARRGRHRLLFVGVAVLAVLVTVSALSVQRREPSAHVVTASTATSVPVSEPSTAPEPTAPAGLPLCRSDALEYHPGGGGLLRFFNIGTAACGLAGHPEIQGLDASGTWRAVSAYLSPDDPHIGAPWTGTFRPGEVAVIVMSFFAPTGPSDACPHGQAAQEPFSAMRLVLPNGAGIIDVPEGGFVSGPCRLAISPFGYDSTDQ